MSKDLIKTAEALIGRFHALEEHGKTHPNAVIFEMIDIREELLGMVPALVTEIKRLQERATLHEAEIASWIADRDQWIKRYEASQARNTHDERAHEALDVMRRREIATWQAKAKELSTRASQETGYLVRLEKEFVDLAVLTRFWTEQEAQAALAKIRAGDK